MAVIFGAPIRFWPILLLFHTIMHGVCIQFWPPLLIFPHTSTHFCAQGMMVIFRCVDDSIQFAASAQLSAQVVMVTNMDVILEVILFPYSQQLCRGRCVRCLLRIGQLQFRPFCFGTHSSYAEGAVFAVCCE